MIKIVFLFALALSFLKLNSGSFFYGLSPVSFSSTACLPSFTYVFATYLCTSTFLFGYRSSLVSYVSYVTTRTIVYICFCRCIVLVSLFNHFFSQDFFGSTLIHTYFYSLAPNESETKKQKLRKKRIMNKH